MKFLATAELGRLCKWLRILGYDCEYVTETNLVALTIKSLQEDRIILTRNIRLGARAGYRVVHIKGDHVKDQLGQVVDVLKIEPRQEAMFTRCIICNLALDSIEKRETQGKVPSFVYETNDKFVKCGKCGRIYWQGTHWGNVREYLDGIHS